MDIVIAAVREIAGSVVDRVGCDRTISPGRAVYQDKDGAWQLAAAKSRKKAACHATGLTLEDEWPENATQPGEGPEGTGASVTGPTGRKVATAGVVWVGAFRQHEEGEYPVAGLEEGKGYYLSDAPGGVCDWNNLSGPEDEHSSLIGHAQSHDVLVLHFVHAVHS